MQADPLDTLSGLLQEWVLAPLLYWLDMMRWEDVAQNFAAFMIYGAVQVTVVFAVCAVLERWRPVERRAPGEASDGSVGVDILYTLIARVGILPLFTYVLFYRAQTALNGWMADQGVAPPTLETLFPPLMGHTVIVFLLYAVILDCAEYWRHRLSHRFGVWYALHSLHHAQRRMTFWSDDRNHVLDDLISALWFGAVALLIGVSPLQFPLMALGLRALESLSHANARIGFGWLGDRLLVSPRFHRAHHGILAAGQRSCNYGAVLPWWDMLFGTADFGRAYARTGDPSAEEAMHTGNWMQQQAAGLRRFRRMLGRAARRRTPGALARTRG